MKNLFYGINDEQITPWLFSTTIRSLLVDNILNNIELNHQDLKSVIERVKNEFNYKASIDEEKQSENFSSEQGRVNSITLNFKAPNFKILQRITIHVA